MKKSIFASKTFWVNILGAMVSAAGIVAGFPQIAVYAAPILAIANIGLRVVTEVGVYVPGFNAPPVAPVPPVAPAPATAK
jgi:hypothetical protein